MEKRVTAIILAAGKGKRMNTGTPKQYLMLCGKPVLYYSIKAFEDANIDDIIIVTGAGEEEQCKTLLLQYDMRKQYTIVTGGKERYDSVYEGLKAASNADFVLIHDGARPLIKPEQIKTLISAVKEKQAAILAVPVKDTIKRVNNDGIIEKTMKRDELYIVQTPQAFSYQMLIKAYEGLYADSVMNQKLITDDAMIIENYSDYQIHLVEGSYENIKITTPEDISMAEHFITHEK